MAEHDGGRTRPVRIAAAVLSASVVAAASVGTWEAVPAAAEVGGATLQFTCSLPPFPDLAMTAQIRWTAPDTVLVGRSIPAVPVSATAMVGPSFTQAAAAIGATTVEGTASIPVVVHAPEGAIGLTLPLTAARTRIPTSGPTNIPAAGSAPVVVVHKPGLATITIGSQLALTLVPRAANGGLATAEPIPVSCTLNPGQDTAMFSVKIRAAPVAPAPTSGGAPSGGATRPPPSPGAGPTSAGTRPGATPNPSPAASGTTHPTATDAGRPTTDSPDSTSATPTTTPDTTTSTSPSSPDATTTTPAASDTAVGRAAGSTRGRWLVLGVVVVAVAAATGSAWWLMRRRRRVA